MPEPRSAKAIQAALMTAAEELAGVAKKIRLVELMTELERSYPDGMDVERVGEGELRPPLAVGNAAWPGLRAFNRQTSHQWCEKEHSVRATLRTPTGYYPSAQGKRRVAARYPGSAVVGIQTLQGFHNVFQPWDSKGLPAGRSRSPRVETRGWTRSSLRDEDAGCRPRSRQDACAPSLPRFGPSTALDPAPSPWPSSRGGIIEAVKGNKP
jgi:hypothetical protein